MQGCPAGVTLMNVGCECDDQAGQQHEPADPDSRYGGARPCSTRNSELCDSCAVTERPRDVSCLFAYSFRNIAMTFCMVRLEWRRPTGWYCHQWISVTVRATPARSPSSIVTRSRTFYHGTRAPTGPPKWHNPLGLSPGCWVATRNALITMSSRVILPIKMHKHGYYSTMLFFYKNR